MLRLRSLSELGVGATLEKVRHKRSRERSTATPTPRIDHADTLYWQMQAHNIHRDWVRDYRFHVKRKWRFDLALPHAKLAIEVDGFGRRGELGGHQSIKGIRANCEKMTEAACLGWRVMRVTSCMVKSGRALAWVERAMVSEQ